MKLLLAFFCVCAVVYGLNDLALAWRERRRRAAAMADHYARASTAGPDARRQRPGTGPVDIHATAAR